MIEPLLYTLVPVTRIVPPIPDALVVAVPSVPVASSVNAPAPPSVNVPQSRRPSTVIVRPVLIVADPLNAYDALASTTSCMSSPLGAPASALAVAEAKLAYVAGFRTIVASSRLMTTFAFGSAAARMRSTSARRLAYVFSSIARGLPPAGSATQARCAGSDRSSRSTIEAGGGGDG